MYGLSYFELICITEYNHLWVAGGGRANALHALPALPASALSGVAFVIKCVGVVMIWSGHLAWLSNVVISYRLHLMICI